MKGFVIVFVSRDSLLEKEDYEEESTGTVWPICSQLTILLRSSHLSPQHSGYIAQLSAQFVLKETRNVLELALDRQYIGVKRNMLKLCLI